MKQVFETRTPIEVFLKMDGISKEIIRFDAGLEDK